MLNFDDYRNTDRYPERPKVPSNQLKTPEDFRKHADELEQYNIAKKKWLEDSQVWAEKAAELDKKFKVDALNELFGKDVERFPKIINKLWALAYEEGHSSGNSGVYNSLVDYVDIVEAIKEDIAAKKNFMDNVYEAK
jgi:hypothetical protein